MVTYLRSLFVKAAIEKALKRKAPNTIPLSGMERLRKRNYYSVHLTDEGNRDRFVVDSVHRKGLEGYWFSGMGNGMKASVPNRFIAPLSLEIIHYAQELELKHRSALGFFWSILSFKAARELCKHRFRVWRFSNKKLARQDRMEILSWAYTWTLEREDHKPVFTPLSYLRQSHGDFIVFHPEKARLARYYSIVFDSLVASGEFEKAKGAFTYSLSPRAPYTLDRYEESDRRHSDNITQQRMLGRLTFALVLVGVGQIVASVLVN
ncbi:hypothetical protein [Ruegeria arenilitoris]|uniref:hypothetical protein n=1 Tax=Ruegeria arenilitoris TaxID=1173585 RepID=UPI00147E1D76|nr:hypothetical protein [Ruegeria arenilitoris]